MAKRRMRRRNMMLKLLRKFDDTPISVSMGGRVTA